MMAGLREWMNYGDILALVGRSSEFANVKVRQEEMGEMDTLPVQPPTPAFRGSACAARTL